MSIPVDDTIAAVATASGRGSVGIVRVSGNRAGAVAERLLGCVPEPRHAALHWFRDAAGDLIDRGLALYFPGPDSYTGEDVLELHGHGGSVVLDLILSAVLASGARLADPGEFSRRAFVNGKMDLAQAEAVADLIDSASRAGARAAARSLRGAFSERLHDLVARLTSLRVHVEAAIDFPEEEIDFLADPELKARIDDIEAYFDDVTAAVNRGRRLRDGLVIVIAGPPNVGKSSLLNRLAGAEAAIVTDIAGTTRDVLREDIQIEGLPLRIVDTAGLHDSADPVEAEGIRRARAAMVHADRVLWIQDATSPAPPPDDLPDRPLTVVCNKIDLVGGLSAGVETGEIDRISVSALTGEGMDVLADYLKHLAGFDDVVEGELIARRRHLDAIDRAHRHLRQGIAEFRDHAAGEIMAEELRLAQHALGEITGRVTSDDLLGEIFSSFCIGK